MALMSSRLAWAKLAARATPSPAGRLSVAFRYGTGEYGRGAAYQQELRATIASLRALGYRVDACEMDDHGRLSGTCRLSVSFFPVKCGPVLMEWLRRHPSRYVCAFLEEGPSVAAFSPAEVSDIASRFA